MRRLKPVLLKTYGKQQSKPSTWIYPDNHKKAFDSSSVSEDSSVFEPPKVQRTRRAKLTGVVGRKAAQLAKKKVMMYLTETSHDDTDICDENCPPHSPPTQESKMAKAKLTGVVGRKAARLAKKKVMMYLTETSHDDTDICDENCPPHSPPTQESKMAKFVN
ncbi:uncharacterized protein KZ484_024528 [Pholidichthys leucotaenia]